MRPWLAALAATAYGCSPYGNGAFSCANNEQCAPNGTCQPNNHCSFPDPNCASMQRYGDHQGSVSGKCVGEEEPPPIDGPVDMPPLIDASCMIGGLNLCGFQAGTPLNISGTDTLNTDNDPRCVTLSQAGGGQDVCLVYVTTVTVTAASTLRAIGGRPLYIASQYDIVVAGTIDAGSDRNGLEGPGANFSSCAVQSNPDNDDGGGGGAAGGSFHGKGGDGGTGDTDRDNNPDDGTAGGGGASNGTNTAPAFARGGCPGGRGGDGNASGSNGGPGGGAVWLFANGTIDVRTGGGIDVTGAGANGGTGVDAGSGGGGSGGYMKLIAPALKIDGTLSANGGGGGEGGSGVTGGDFGGDGELGTSPAGGGNGGSGGNGGEGSATSALDGNNGGGGTSGGGGGGGGAGFIVLEGTRSGAGTITPAPL